MRRRKSRVPRVETKEMPEKIRPRAGAIPARAARGCGGQCPPRSVRPFFRSVLEGVTQSAGAGSRHGGQSQRRDPAAAYGTSSPRSSRDSVSQRREVGAGPRPARAPRFATPRMKARPASSPSALGHRWPAAAAPAGAEPAFTAARTPVELAQMLDDRRIPVPMILGVRTASTTGRSGILCLASTVTAGAAARSQHRSCWSRASVAHGFMRSQSQLNALLGRSCRPHECEAGFALVTA
jgi:hypothetical protein